MLMSDWTVINCVGRSMMKRTLARMKVMSKTKSSKLIIDEDEWRNDGLVHVGLMVLAIEIGDDPRDKDWIPVHQSFLAVYGCLPSAAVWQSCCVGSSQAKGASYDFTERDDA